MVLKHITYASDDYGTPILIQSEKLKQTPQEYVAHWNKRDYEDFTAFDIGFDFFYKTSSEENISFVQDVFKKIEKNGHIYEKEIIQVFVLLVTNFFQTDL